MNLSVFCLKGNRMRALLILGLLAGLLMLTGCATMTQSSADVRHTYSRVWDYELHQMSDDWNLMWMLDRPSRLTRWQMR